MGQQPYGQAAYILPTLNRTVSGPLGVPTLNEDQQLPSLPYAIVPVDQPIMMVNYSAGTPILQPMRYRSYGNLPDAGMLDAPRDQMHNFDESPSSAAENVYYQLVRPAIR